MSTDRICKIIEDNAVKEAYDRLTGLAKKFNSDIGLSGTVADVTIEAHSGTESVTAYTSEILKAIVDQLIEKRAEGIKKKAVVDFLRQHNSFYETLSLIENRWTEE